MSRFCWNEINCNQYRPLYVLIFPLITSSTMTDWFTTLHKIFVALFISLADSFHNSVKVDKVLVEEKKLAIKSAKPTVKLQYQNYFQNVSKHNCRLNCIDLFDLCSWLSCEFNHSFLIINCLHQNQDIFFQHLKGLRTTDRAQLRSQQDGSVLMNDPGAASTTVDQRTNSKNGVLESVLNKIDNLGQRPIRISHNECFNEDIGVELDNVNLPAAHPHIYIQNPDNPVRKTVEVVVPVNAPSVSKTVVTPTPNNESAVGGGSTHSSTHMANGDSTEAP